ncbi:MAG: FAD-dependent oxidoreductase [Candidatus Aquicultor sp.]
MAFFKKFVLVVIIISALSLSLGVGMYTEQIRPHAGKLDTARRQMLESLDPDTLRAADGAEPTSISQSYDVVVFGGTPEAVAAALSSVRHGLKVCLAYKKGTLGGVWADARLNQLDNTYAKISSPGTSTTYALTSRGINEGFMKLLGTKKMENGFSDGVFDSAKVKPVFQRLLADNKITSIAFKDFDLNVSDRRVQSIKLKTAATTGLVAANYFIDGSENGDLAAKAGCPYTLGRHNNIYGTLDKPIRLQASDYTTDTAQMSATLMFRLGGVDWEYLSNVIFGDKVDKCARCGNAGWGYNLVCAGFHNPKSAANGIMLSGLNLGRQSDGSVLINGLQVFNVDGTSEQSVQDGVKRAKNEVPQVVSYLKSKVPAFKSAYLIDTADTLYIRESRHFIGEYVMTMDDLLKGAQYYDSVTVGNHPADIHPYTMQEALQNLSRFGNLVDLHLQPRLYGIPLRSLLPMKVDNLVVVGRTISCTPQAASSTRVISIGISEAEAVGSIIGISKHLDRPLKHLALDQQFWATNIIE